MTDQPTKTASEAFTDLTVAMTRCGLHLDAWQTANRADDAEGRRNAARSLTDDMRVAIAAWSALAVHDGALAAVQDALTRAGGRA